MLLNYIFSYKVTIIFLCDFSIEGAERKSDSQRINKSIVINQ